MRRPLFKRRKKRREPRFMSIRDYKAKSQRRGAMEAIKDQFIQGKVTGEELRAVAGDLIGDRTLNLTHFTNGELNQLSQHVFNIVMEKEEKERQKHE